MSYSYGLEPRGPALTPFELSVPARTAYKTLAGNRQFLDIPKLPKAPPVLNNANRRPSTMKVLGKENFNYRLVPRPQPVPDTDGMFPNQGYARGQRRGLAYTPSRPIDGPLLPIADSDYVFLNSSLGQPK